MMWAAASLQPPKPWPPNTITTTARQPLRRRSLVVNNNIRIREVKTGDNDHRGLSQAVITALKSNGPHQSLDATKSKTMIPSGADVLEALERIAAHKAKRKKEKRRETRAVSKKEDTQGAPCNFDNVRPICIKPEWDDRLKELESRLQQLLLAYSP